jgi:hypothetical protein
MRKRQNDVKKSKAKSKPTKNKQQQRKHAQPTVSLQSQLTPLGYTIEHIAGDGNCLFRSISDQLYGTPNNHLDVRADVVSFLRKHKKDLEDFVEGDYEKYLSRMSRKYSFPSPR